MKAWHRNLIRLILLLTLTLSFPSLGESVTPSRIQELSPSEHSAWNFYLGCSQTNALADAAVTQAEVVAHKMTNAIKAPSGGDFKLKVNASNIWLASDEAKHLADAILSYHLG